MSASLSPAALMAAEFRSLGTKQAFLPVPGQQQQQAPPQDPNAQAQQAPPQDPNAQAQMAAAVPPTDPASQPAQPGPADQIIQQLQAQMAEMLDGIKKMTAIIQQQEQTINGLGQKVAKYDETIRSMELNYNQLQKQMDSENQAMPELMNGYKEQLQAQITMAVQQELPGMVSQMVQQEMAAQAPAPQPAPQPAAPQPGGMPLP